MEELLIFIIAGTISGLIGGCIAHSRGRTTLGFLLGFLLGPIGWLLVLLAKDQRAKCPHCQGVLPAKSVTKCMHCASDLTEEDAQLLQCPRCSHRFLWTAKARALGKCPKCNQPFN